MAPSIPLLAEDVENEIQYIVQNLFYVQNKYV